MWYKNVWAALYQASRNGDDCIYKLAFPLPSQSLNYLTSRDQFHSIDHSQTSHHYAERISERFNMILSTFLLNMLSASLTQACVPFPLPSSISTSITPIPTALPCESPSDTWSCPTTPVLQICYQNTCIGQRCGGFSPNPPRCPFGQTCIITEPMIPDLPGKCVLDTMVCGGFAGFQCADGYVCVQNPNTGGSCQFGVDADCLGLCAKASWMGCVMNGTCT